ncbi:hypothetical protein [uncultured Sphingobacterium sp.]|nr:hypothetical protein [uncultured Sphingobacterium sp.]
MKKSVNGGNGAVNAYRLGLKKLKIYECKSRYWAARKIDASNTDLFP